MSHSFNAPIPALACDGRRRGLCSRVHSSQRVLCDLERRSSHWRHAACKPYATATLYTAAAVAATAAASASAAAVPLDHRLHDLPLQLSPARLVPNFPRIGGQELPEYWAAFADRLPGFNGDELRRLLFPDLVMDAPNITIITLLAVAFVYWEGGILLRQLRERRGGGNSGGDGEDEGSGAPPLPPPSPVELARFERRRGLAWLALLTALSIWMTGIVSSPIPSPL